MANRTNRYLQILEKIFTEKYSEGVTEVPFTRTDIESAAATLGINLPKNLGDVVYSFRYRVSLPESIQSRISEGHEWIIRPSGRGRYILIAVPQVAILPSLILAEVKLPDSTPGVINKYALSDEQALLAKIRYNRLIDIFTCLTCYSLQNHLRTTVEGLGQVETDEIYIGIDRRGAHYILPIQAKRAKEKVGIVQIEQDFAICAEKFPELIPKPIAAQFMGENLIALFEFTRTAEGIRVAGEKHYRLVSPDDLTAEDLLAYQRATP
jgi:hypothetical protein